MEVEFLVVEADEGGEVAMVEIVLVASVEVESPADEGDEGVEVAMLEIELIASMEVGLPVGKVNEGGKVAMLMLLINDAHPTSITDITHVAAIYNCHVTIISDWISASGSLNRMDVKQTSYNRNPIRYAFHVTTIDSVNMK